MLESIVFRCRPGAQFHFGKIALDVDTSLHATSEILRSDSLASALVATAARVFPKNTFDAILSDWKDGKVRVSSLYFCLQTKGDQFIYFLPKPASFDTLEPGKNKDGSEKERKSIYRIRFISKGVWEQGILPAQWDDLCTVLEGGFLVTLAELEAVPEEARKKIKVFSTTSLPKVAVHKETRDNAHYFQTNIQLPNLSAIEGLEGIGVHFYFLLESADGALREHIHTLAQILADEGIGGERSTGCGKLESCDPPRAFGVQTASHLRGRYASTSLSSPFDQTELDNCLAYRVETRAGRRTVQKNEEIPFLKRLKMLSEGTVSNTALQGKHHDITPENGPDAFFRFGAPVCLPLHDHFDLNIPNK